MTRSPTCCQQHLHFPFPCPLIRVTNQELQNADETRQYQCCFCNIVHHLRNQRSPCSNRSSHHHDPLQTNLPQHHHQIYSSSNHYTISHHSKILEVLSHHQSAPPQPHQPQPSFIIHDRRLLVTRKQQPFASNRHLKLLVTPSSISQNMLEQPSLISQNITIKSLQP